MVTLVLFSQNGLQICVVGIKSLPYIFYKGLTFNYAPQPQLRQAVVSVWHFVQSSIG